MIILSVILAMKFFRAPTWDAFLYTFFLFTKVAFSLLLFLIDKSIFCWFLIIHISIWVLFAQPMYDGPHRFKPVSNLDTFEKAVLEE
jgi:hypothetical protein